MDPPTRLEPATAHDSCSSTAFGNLVGQRTGDSGSASDTTHTTSETLLSSLGSVGSGGEDDAVAPLPMRKSYHRHVSRSAAKRDSVAQLPSIRDLQLHFSSGGVSHRAGAGVGIRPSPLTNGPARDSEQAKPWREVHLARVAPFEARKEANSLAREVSALWSLGSSSSSPEDVRGVFVTTASAVRRVRTLALSLIPPGQRRVSTPSRPPVAFSTPSRPSGGTPSTRVVSNPVPASADAGAPMRRAALDFLGHLRTLEERLRDGEAVPTVIVVPENAAPALIDSPLEETHEPSRSRSLSPATEGASSQGAATGDDEWSDDEDYDVNAAARLAEATRSHPPWEERILAEARAYRPLTAADWAKESWPVREASKRWADVVGRLFREHVDKSTDAWVVEGANGIERVHAFLTAHLSTEHAALLPPSSQDEQLMARLSDGYLLAHAYNSYLLTSARPWGFVPDDDLHDTLGDGAESEAGREWTFRRVENLMAWAAAVRMRFNLPIAMPTVPGSSPVAAKAAAQAVLGRRRSLQSFEFDPLTIAKHSDGWEGMLRTIVVAWVTEAAREVRERVPEPVAAEAKPEPTGEKDAVGEE